MSELHLANNIMNLYDIIDELVSRSISWSSAEMMTLKKLVGTRNCPLCNWQLTYQQASLDELVARRWFCKNSKCRYSWIVPK